MHIINTTIVKADDRISPTSERRARSLERGKEKAHVSHSSKSIDQVQAQRSKNIQEPLSANEIARQALQSASFSFRSSDSEIGFSDQQERRS
jgi:transcriptional regulator GlxA family with amidase domain